MKFVLKYPTGQKGTSTGVNKKPQKFIFEYWVFSQKSYLNVGCFRPLSAPFLFRTSEKGTDSATPLDMEKYGRIDFSPSNQSDIIQNTPKLMGTHAKVDTELVRTFLCSLSRLQESLFQGWSLKNAKGPRLTWMSACWLVKVFARPITAEDTSELIPDLEIKLCYDWSVHS